MGMLNVLLAAFSLLSVGVWANVAAAKQPYRQLFFNDQRLFVRAGF